MQLPSLLLLKVVPFQMICGRCKKVDVRTRGSRQAGPRTGTTLQDLNDLWQQLQESLQAFTISGRTLTS